LEPASGFRRITQAVEHERTFTDEQAESLARVYLYLLELRREREQTKERRLCEETTQ
jgi:hypothetical protein